MMKFSSIKRRYMEFRFGANMLTPVFGYSNFILITYNFGSLSSMIPFSIFVPMFSISVILSLTVFGYFFRTRQLSTDQDLVFRKNKLMVQALSVILESSLFPDNNEIREKALLKLEELRGIEAVA